MAHSTFGTALARARSLAPGDKLGSYELIRQISAGETAELHLARTIGTDSLEQLVIIERLLPQYAGTSSSAASFLADARFAQALSHPNIARLLAVSDDHAASEVYLVREYLHGQDLAAVLAAARSRETPVPLDAALSIVIAAAAALHHAHDAAQAAGTSSPSYVEIGARDIHLAYDGTVKLVHVGRAGGDAERRADVHALGALFYELTVDEGELGRELPTAVVPDYPAPLEAIVMRALATDPAARYASARDLAMALATFADENRLRVAPAVTAQLLAVLYPHALDAWVAARAQGAFFVEQCVVAALFGPAPPVDDDLTAVTQPPVTVDGVPEEDDPALPPPPSAPAPNPSSPALVYRAAQAVQTTPHLTPTKPLPAFAPAQPGTRSSSSNLTPPPMRTSHTHLPSASAASSLQLPADLGEVTEQVNVGRLAARRRRVHPVLVALAFVGTAGLGAVAYLAVAQMATESMASAPPAAPPRVVASAAPSEVPAPPPVAAAVPPPAPVEPVVAPAPPPPKKIAPATSPKTVAKPGKRRPPVRRAKLKKPQRKDEPWNDDSPFMPVRAGSR